MVANLLGWASPFQHPRAQVLRVALEDVERLFAAVWTEIDEALGRLALITTDPAHADEHLRVAMGFLHRWQDR